MGARTEIEKKIEKKNLEILSLEGQIREAKAFVAGLQEALRSLPREGTDTKPQEQQFRQGSDMAKVMELLKKEGKPLYITDILKGIGKEVTTANSKSISGALNNYFREGRIFKRTGANTYGLIDFEYPTDTTDELPDDFGKDIEEDIEADRVS